MKNSNFWVKLSKIALCPALILALVVMSCMFLNFLLVPPSSTIIIETVMADAREHKGEIDIGFFGTSRTYRGIDSYDLSKDLDKEVFNIAYESANYIGLYYFLEELSDDNNLQYVFLEGSITNFSRNNSSQDNFVYRTLKNEYKNSFGREINLNYIDFPLLEFTNYMENFSNDRFVECVSVKFKGPSEIGTNVSNSPKSKYLGNGFLYADYVIKDDYIELPESYIKDDLWQDTYATKLQLKYFKKIVSLCEEKNIDLILYSPPYPEEISKRYYKDFDEFNSFLRNLSPKLRYLDFSLLKNGDFEWKNKYFYNANHLNGLGATELEKTIKIIIDDLNAKTFDENNYFYSSFEEMISNLK